MKQTAHQHEGDQPLPQSMAAKLAGWSALAHQYPIFSRTWFAYRTRAFVMPLVLLALTLLVVVALARPEAPANPLRFYLNFAAIWLVVALALLLGRALAVLVYQRKWSPRREAAGVAAALLLGVLVALSLTPFTRNWDRPVQRSEERQDSLINLVVWLPVLLWLGGAFDLAAYFRQRGLLHEAALMEELERYKNERNQVEVQLSLLASQVEPHFLFNTLSGVRAAMSSDPARGIVLLDHLIDYLRSTIPQLRADRAHLFVALGAQLDSVQAYLGIIEARMPRLRSRIDCAPELRGVAIPPLMLISLVENAVKHGIELKKGPAQIQVTATRTRKGELDMLELSVADDGVGFGAATTGSGIGLSNIRERLGHLYGGAASMSLRAGDTGGVVASIVLPLSATLEQRES
jgi:signal transduction histidine kinase